VSLVRDFKTDHISKNFKECDDLIGCLRETVQKMILQVGGLAPIANKMFECGMVP
jgi:hypothetical protein